MFAVTFVYSIVYFLGLMKSSQKEKINYLYLELLLHRLRLQVTSVFNREYAVKPVFIVCEGTVAKKRKFGK